MHKQSQQQQQLQLQQLLLLQQLLRLPPAISSSSFICNTNKMYPIQCSTSSICFTLEQSQAKNKLKSLWHFDRYSYKSKDRHTHHLAYYNM